MTCLHLLSYKGCEPVLRQKRVGETICALDFSQTSRRPATALESLGHLPLRRRIKKGQFFACMHRRNSDEIHGIGVEEAIRMAAVVTVLEEGRLQGEVFLFPSLHRDISRRFMDTAGREGLDHLARIIGAQSIQGQLAGGGGAQEGHVSMGADGDRVGRHVTSFYGLRYGAACVSGAAHV
jgi:hypothetical protein